MSHSRLEIVIFSYATRCFKKGGFCIKKAWLIPNRAHWTIEAHQVSHELSASQAGNILFISLHVNQLSTTRVQQQRHLIPFLPLGEMANLLTLSLPHLLFFVFGRVFTRREIDGPGRGGEARQWVGALESLT